VETDKFRGSAQNSAFRRKLWSLLISTYLSQLLLLIRTQFSACQTLHESLQLHKMFY